MVDDYYRHTCVFLMKCKTETILYMKNFFRMVPTQFGHSVKVVRNDNDREFLNHLGSGFFCDLGVIHQTSCAFTPQQNGPVERKHRHILDVTRSMRFQAYIPIKLWGYCVLAACHVINLLPFDALHGESPHDMLHKVEPDLKYLHVMGCLCFIKHLPVQGKLDP